MDFNGFLSERPLLEVLSYWLSIRMAGGVPRKSDLDPLHMPQHVLPGLFLFRKTEDDRFLCKLMGTGACDAFGRDPTGRHLDEIIPLSDYSSRKDLFKTALVSGMPVGYKSVMGIAGRGGYAYRILLLPLQKDRVPDHVLGMIVFPKAPNLRWVTGNREPQGNIHVVMADEDDLSFFSQPNNTAKV